MELGKNKIKGYIEEDLLWIKAEKARGITRESAETICEKYEKIFLLTEEYDLDRWVLYEYASFLDDQNHYSKAIEVAEKLKRYYGDSHNSIDEEDYAALSNTLGTLYRNTQRFSDAEAYYLTAIEIHKRLVDRNPNAFEPDLAASYKDCQTMQKIEKSKVCRKFELLIK